MDVLSLIRKRRSIRHFKGDEIPKEDVEKLLEAARWAPSAGNRQPVEIIIIESPSQKEQLAEAALQQRFIEAAPVVFAFCADLDRSSARYGTRGSSLYAIQDAAAATQNVLLTATALGLGTCWIGAFDEKRAAKVLKLPSHVRPLAIVPIGKPDRGSTAPPRRDIDDFTHHEEFGQ
ncbi:MAG: nitroreductase family protein [Candidatus Hodarchaeales archaeon]|jgi:nitroreductase